LDARLILVTANKDRHQDLVSTSNVSKQRYDEVVFEYDSVVARLSSANAQVAKLDAALESLDVQIDLSNIRTPFGGIIIARNLDEGAVTNPGQSILSLIDDLNLELRVGIPAGKTDNLSHGTSYVISVRNLQIDATLSTVVASIDTGTRTVTGILNLNAPTAILRTIRHGELARVSIPAKINNDGFWLPTTALTEGRRGMWSAYVVIPNEGDANLGRLDRRDVQVIHEASDKVFVRGTINPNDTVVANGVHKLMPKQTVKTLN
jgi:RND family efflux transporter MFP subunit